MKRVLNLYAAYIFAQIVPNRLIKIAVFLILSKIYNAAKNKPESRNT